MQTNPADNPYLTALKGVAIAGLGVGGLLLLFSIAGTFESGQSGQSGQSGESNYLFVFIALGVFGLGFIVLFIWLFAGAITWGSLDAAPLEALVASKPTAVASEAPPVVAVRDTDGAKDGAGAKDVTGATPGHPSA
ncbi:MAG: hypothetical protein H7248_09700 [Microbacteriaceae bacterium]|nr:hypothetical protein [Microbacteriaceae bacterium]